MPKKRNQARSNRSREVRIRGVRRERVDIRKLGQVIIALAQAQAEKEAQAQHDAQKKARSHEGTESA